MQASRDLQKVLAQDPKNSPAVALQAVIAALEGRLDEALDEMERAIQLDPTLPAHYNNLGWIYLRKGELTLALENLSWSLQMSPASCNSHITRSLVRYRLGNLGGAHADCLSAVRLDPDEALVHNPMYLRNIAGNLDWALEYYGWAEQSGAPLVLVYQGRGDAYRVNGQAVAALASYEKGLGLSPSNPALHLARGLACVQAGRPEEARADFSQALVLANTITLRHKAENSLRSLEGALLPESSL
jgi:Tfp pilus assembly protein PilF